MGICDISWIDDWQKWLLIIKSRPSCNSDRHYVLMKPATCFIHVKLYSLQCRLRIRLVYLTVVAHNIQYLQHFCDDMENSCIMNLKWLRLQSILFYRGNIYWVWHRTLFLALIWSVYFVSGDHICMRTPCENVNNSLNFWAYPPISHFLEHLAFVPFRFFGCDGSVTDTFLYRFREHYKRWIWSISLKHSTKRPSASFWAFCGWVDQLKMLTSFL